MSHGLEVNAEVDERYHVEKSTVAACKYLRNAYERYGNWALAAASYNLGQGGVDKQLGRQKRDNYFDLLLNEETGRYVFRILAMKEILRDPERYGFHLRKKDLYAPYRTRTTTINGGVPDLADWAIANGTDYKTLKLLNPWLRDNHLTNREGRTYAVLLPAEGFDSPPRWNEPCDEHVKTDAKKKGKKAPKDAPPIYRCWRRTTSRCSVPACTTSRTSTCASRATSSW